MPAHRIRGFTLIELMITIAILAILAAISYPSYRSYVQRSRVPSGLDALTIIAGKMELMQASRTDGTYGPGPACNVPLGVAKDFSLSCTVTGGGTGFVARATGSGPLAGYAYSINQSGARATDAHPNGSNSTCWAMKGGTACDD
jgi:type IV pilus assembly protein PilE